MQSGLREYKDVRDLTLPLGPWIPVWPGDPHLVVEPVTSLSRGDHYNMSRVSFGTHLGTHVDAPLHVLAGAPGVEQLGLEQLLGPALVLEFPYDRHIDAGDLVSLPPCSRILFKTRNSVFWERLLRTSGHAGSQFGAECRGTTSTEYRNTCDAVSLESDFVALTPAAARLLVARGVKTVGVDGPSVDPAEAEALPAHHILLGAGVAVIESLNLTGIEAGEWFLCCLPVRLVGGDGAPARVVVMR